MTSKKLKEEEQEEVTPKKTQKKETGSKVISQTVQKHLVIDDDGQDDDTNHEEGNQSTLSDDPPKFSFIVLNSHPYSADLQIISHSPIYVWCISRPLEDPVPSTLEIISTQQHYFAESGTTMIGDLKPDRSYRAFCYAESNTGVPMEENIATLAKAFTTTKCKD